MFLNDLIVKRVVGVKNTWIVQQPLIYQKINLCIKVPKGFIFDFASVPKLFWNIFPPNGGRYDRAACLHDWLYATHIYTKSESDYIFYIAMLDDKTPKWKAKLFYWAVKLFGKSAWKNGGKLKKYAGKDEIKL